MKIMFLPPRVRKPLKDNVKEALGLILKKHRKIGLVTTSTYNKMLASVSDFLMETGKEPVTGEGYKPQGKGEILGCDVAAARSIAPKVEVFLYIGDGKFHPMDVYLKTKKQVFIFNPLLDNVYELDYDDAQDYEKKRFMRLGKVKSAGKIGILVSTKIGQANLRKAMDLKRILEERGTDSYILVFDTLNPASLADFSGIDAFINTACPRIADDDFPKPVVNADIFLESLK